MAAMNERDKRYIVAIILALFLLCLLNYFSNKTQDKDIEKLQKAVAELQKN